MSRTPALWPDPASHIRHAAPEMPTYYMRPDCLQATARRFRCGFPGLVTYAVKANDAPVVLENLVAAGIGAFDVASVAEMERVCAVLPSAVLHYNNPVRSRAEIRAGIAMGCVSWAVDSLGELEKLRDEGVAQGAEIAVRYKLPVAGAAYDFGEKFGADPVQASEIMRRAARLGYRVSLGFHPGTQCADPAAWAAYVRAAGEIAARAAVRPERLNAGGGFAAPDGAGGPDLEAIFRAMAEARAAAFPAHAPALFCEPGRAMVAAAFRLAVRVKAIRADGAVFLNDGIYGHLGERPAPGALHRFAALSPDGTPRRGRRRPRTVFGPTCDSLDRLPEELALPGDLAEGDYMLFHDMGAYAGVTATGFNGYGDCRLVTVGSW